MEQPTRLLCPWDFPGKNTGVGSHALLQRIFPTLGLNSRLPLPPALQEDSLPTEPTGKPHKHPEHLLNNDKLDTNCVVNKNMIFDLSQIWIWTQALSIYLWPHKNGLLILSTLIIATLRLLWELNEMVNYLAVSRCSNNSNSSKNLDNSNHDIIVITEVEVLLPVL